ncbi:DedA family protein [Nonomuraea thailandensis]
MTDWLIGLMESLGAVGAGLAIALENLFPPLPSEVILPLAGFTAAKGSMDLVDVLVCTTLGSVVGALALYAVGALLGRERTLAIAAKLPWSRSPTSRRPRRSSSATDARPCSSAG